MDYLQTRTCPEQKMCPMYFYIISGHSSHYCRAVSSRRSKYYVSYFVWSGLHGKWGKNVPETSNTTECQKKHFFYKRIKNNALRYRSAPEWCVNGPLKSCSCSHIDMFCHNSFPTFYLYNNLLCIRTWSFKAGNLTGWKCPCARTTPNSDWRRGENCPLWRLQLLGWQPSSKRCCPQSS